MINRFRFLSKLFSIIKLILLYLVGLVILNFIFSYLYSNHSIIPINYLSNSKKSLIFWDYMYFSLITFFSIGYGDISPITYTGKLLSVIEGAVGSIYSFVFAGFFAYRLLKPVNPILFSKYIVIDNTKKTIFFRYRICYPSGRFLYNTTARIRIIKKKDLVVGQEHNDYFSYEQKYNLIRGVWYAEIHESNPKYKEFIKKAEKIDSTNDNYVLIFNVTGTDDEGNSFYKAKRYKLSDIKFNYSFVSVRRSEYNTEKYQKDGIEKYNPRNINKITKCEDENICTTNSPKKEK